MNKKRKPLELYVHIPFCIRKCAYCDFVSGPGTKAMQKEYEEALLAEIDAAEETAESEVISAFFGGGTPSAVDAGMLARVMEKLRSKYVFSEDAEITLEANPGTLDAEKLKCYRKSGFNRISIGCQSVHDEELKRLGRIHTFAEFQESFALARDAGFANINVDLMSGLPEQSDISLPVVTYEGLASIGADYIFLMATDEDKAELDQNAVWNSLPAVQSVQVVELPASPYFNQGYSPIGRELLLDEILEMLDGTAKN